MSNIGFIGVGIMGAPMAAHLQAAGHQLFLVKHTSPLPQELLDEGAIACTSCKEVAEQAEIIIIMVPDTPQVAETLFGSEGVTSGLNTGKTIIDMSSISPSETRSFASKINDLGCEYLDAPVSGGEVGAKAASLTIMVGGQPEVFERIKPLFELMGQNISLVGDYGAGQTCKISNQIIVALTIEAVGEALLFASKAGVDPAKVRNALMGGFAGSKILEIHGERMIKRTFNPGFSIALHQKDLNLALSGAREMGISLPNTASTQELFNACDRNQDHSSMVKALELLGKHEISSDSVE